MLRGINVVMHNGWTMNEASSWL